MAGKDGVEGMEIENTLPEENSEEGSEHPSRIVQLPLTRIKAIMKMDPDVTLSSQDAVIMIAKATELFVQSMAKDAYNYTMKTKRKTVQKKDFELAVDNIEELAFLEESSACYDQPGFGPAKTEQLFQPNNYFPTMMPEYQ